jgi:hypothetical protein
MKSLGLRFLVGLAVALAAVCANASSDLSLTPARLHEGPEGDIATLTEEQYYVDGAASSARVFTFSNGTRSLHFIPMIHQAEPAFYEAVAGEVKHLKAQGMDLFYEFIDFETATLADKRRIRAMYGLIPTPDFYAKNASGGWIGQDNSMFLGFPSGTDVNVDLTPAELADAYEKLAGPLDISDKNLVTPIDEFVMPTADAKQITRVTIDQRNRHLAQAINEAQTSVIVLYGAAHVAGTMKNLFALDPSWRRET